MLSIGLGMDQEKTAIAIIKTIIFFISIFILLLELQYYSIIRMKSHF
jgi:hypothetical protein